MSSSRPILGVTGPIASGKDEIVQMLSGSFHFKVIDADKIGHALLKKDPRVRRKVRQVFGTLDRKQLGTVVFSDPGKLRILNRIMHPRILSKVRQEVDTYQKKSSRPSQCMVINAALLHQIGLDRFVDAVWFVEAPLWLRVQRLTRQGLSSQEGKRRSALQKRAILSYRSKADQVIRNVGSKQVLKSRVLPLFRRFLARYNKHRNMCNLHKKL